MNAASPAPAVATARSRGAAVAFWLIFGLCAGVYLWVHGSAGFAFPVPWPDESSFLWPAIAVQEHSSLFAPELNPDRHVLWMPPGYAIAMGAIFKITGFSLAWARMLSAIFMLGAFACLAGVARTLRFPIAAMLVLGGVFLGRYFVLMGNFARMEALLVLAVAAAALLLVRGSLEKALAVLLLCPLVHPNGIYLTAPMGLYVVWKLAARRSLLRPTWAEGALVAAAAIAWLCYAIYVGQHWSDFLHDMQHQLRWKQQPGPLGAVYWSRWLATPHLITSALLLLVVACGAALRAASTRLMLLAVPVHLIPVTPNEWYYQVFRGLLFALVGLVAIDLCGRALARSRPHNRATHAISAACCFALICGAGFAAGSRTPSAIRARCRSRACASTPSRSIWIRKTSAPSGRSSPP